MAKDRHSKYKNTGILFELLVRQITNDMMLGNNNSPASHDAHTSPDSSPCSPYRSTPESSYGTPSCFY